MKKTYRLFIIIPVLFLMTVGFAAIVISSNINSETSFMSNQFSAHYENMYDKLNNTENVNMFSLNDDGKTFTATPVFNDIGDTYLLYAELVNDSDFPIEVENINTTIDSELTGIISTYIYQKDKYYYLKKGELLLPQERLKLEFHINFYPNNDLDETYLNKGTVTANVTFAIEFKNRNNSYMNDYFLGVNQPKDYMTSKAVKLSMYDREEYSGMYLYAPSANEENPIYFYRGKQDVQNHVYFAGYCWRIIRTTINGNVKLLYNGTLDSEGHCSYNTKSSSLPGFSIRPSSTPYTNEQTYYTSMYGVNNINTWYENNLSSYDEYIKDEPFCETQIPNGGFTEEDINLECTNGHQFSVATGELTYPIAAVDYMELIVDGLHASYLDRYKSDYSQNCWFNSNSEYYILGSITEYNNRRVPIEFYRYDGINNLVSSSDTSHVKPVIHVDKRILNNGTGSNCDPYRLEPGGF